MSVMQRAFFLKLEFNSEQSFGNPISVAWNGLFYGIFSAIQGTGAAILHDWQHLAGLPEAICRIFQPCDFGTRLATEVKPTYFYAYMDVPLSQGWWAALLNRIMEANRDG